MVSSFPLIPADNLFVDDLTFPLGIRSQGAKDELRQGSPRTIMMRIAYFFLLGHDRTVTSSFIFSSNWRSLSLGLCLSGGGGTAGMKNSL